VTALVLVVTTSFPFALEDKMVAQTPGSWFAAADYARDKQCRERQSTGSCGCVSRRKRKTNYNPCDRAEQVIESCDALSRGYPPALEVAEIIQWFERHRCRDHRCNHRGCSRADAVLEFLRTADTGKDIA
jgi:hypothetical protein